MCKFYSTESIRKYLAISTVKEKNAVPLHPPAQQEYKESYPLLKSKYSVLGNESVNSEMSNGVVGTCISSMSSPYLELSRTITCLAQRDAKELSAFN